MKAKDKIERLIKDFRVTAGAKIYQHTLADVMAAQNKSQTTISASDQPNIWRIIMKSKITKLTAAAVIIIAVIIGISQLSTPFDASQAFADAMNIVIEARTLSYLNIQESTYEDGRKWVIKNRYMFKEPDLKRQEHRAYLADELQSEFVRIKDYAQRQILEYIPAEKQAAYSELWDNYKVDPETGLLVLSQLDTYMRDLLIDWSQKAVEDLGMVELEDLTVRVLQSHYKYSTMTVWINPETNLPVQIEFEDGDSEFRELYSSIEIDVELTDNLFSLDLPEGYDLIEPPTDGWSYKEKITPKIRFMNQVVIRYIQAHNYQFPSELEDLVSAGFISKEVFSNILAPADDPGGPPMMCYIKPRLNADPSTGVVLFEAFDQWPEEGIVVCFMDLHSQIITDQQRFMELIK